MCYYIVLLRGLFMIDSIIELITANTWSLLITIILCIMIVLCILKRFSKMLIISIFVLLVYIGYLFFTGQKIPMNKDEILEHGSEQLKKYKIEDKIKKMEDDVKDKVKEDLLKKSEKEIEKRI